MNSLSWFLYWIDVLGSLSSVTSAAAVLLILAMMVLWVACALRMDDERSEDVKQAVRNGRNTWTWRLAAMAGCFAVIASFLPSKGTMYAIAASEVGERVAKSEAVQSIATDATKALQIWIKKQIDPEKKS